MKRSANPNSDKMKAEFRRKLENYQAAPSETLWDKIELSLDKEEALVYKNRFRVYSGLAAACLALLIAFAVIFVPRKWQQLQNQEAEIAAAKTPEINKPKSKTETLFLKEKQPQKAKLPQEELALNTPETGSNETQPFTGNTVSKQEKKVGSKAQKGTLRSHRSITENVAQTASVSGMIAAAMPAKPVASSPESPISDSGKDFEEVTLAAVSPEEVKTESSEEISENENQSAPEVAVASSSKIQTEPEKDSQPAARPAVVAGNISGRNTAKNLKSPAGISDLSQTPSSSFSNQNPTVSEVAKTETSVVSSPENETEMPQAGLAKAQDETNAVKAENAVALAENGTETEKKDLEKAGRWTVSGNYGALSFNSGIRLAGRAFEPQPPNMGSTGSNYNQNIDNYKTAIQEYNHETSAAYSQKAGVLVGFKMAKNWLLQTGLSYFQNREQTNSSYVFAKNPGNVYPQPGLTAEAETPTTLQTVLSDNFNPDNSQVMPASEYTTLYSYQYYNVPLNLRFQTGEPGIYYFAGAGGAVNFLDQTTVEILENTSAKFSVKSPGVQPEKDAQPDVYRKSILSVQLETGLGYSFNSHLSAELALTGNQFLKPLIKEVQMAGVKQQNARSFGATLNLGYTF